MVNDIDLQFQNLVNKAALGDSYPTRMGIKCYSVFAPNPIKTKDFPIISLRKQFWKSIVMELIWLLKGDSKLDFLQKHGVKFWDPWAYPDNTLGKAYPHQFRYFTSEGGWSDQFVEILSQVKNHSDSRRIMMNIWNSAELSEMAIPPCCFAHQVRIVNGQVHVFVFQRSCDVLVGLPQNMATYGLLQRIYAKVGGLEPGIYHHLISDAHVYSNQIKDAKKIIDMDLSPFTSVPYITIDDSLNSPEAFLKFLNDSDNMSTEEIMNLFGLHNYEPADYFKIPVNVQENQGDIVLTKETDNNSWEDEENDMEIIPDHEAEDAIANSCSKLRVIKTLDGRVVISATTSKKDFN